MDMIFPLDLCLIFCFMRCFKAYAWWKLLHASLQKVAFLACPVKKDSLLYSILYSKHKVVHMIAPYVSLVFMKESCILIVLMLVHCNFIYNIIYALYNVSAQGNKFLLQYQVLIMVLCFFRAGNASITLDH